MKIVDDVSPPGSWDIELKAAPWGYGQSQCKKLETALNNIRKQGLWEEIEVINAELTALRRELESLRGN